MKQSASYLHHEIIYIHGTCPLVTKLRFLKDAFNFRSNVEILLYFLQDNLEMYFNARVSAGLKRVNLRLYPKPFLKQLNQIKGNTDLRLYLYFTTRQKY